MYNYSSLLGDYAVRVSVVPCGVVDVCVCVCVCLSPDKILHHIIITLIIYYYNCGHVSAGPGDRLSLISSAVSATSATHGSLLLQN